MNNFICSKSSKSSNENMTVSPNYCNILIIIILSYMLTHSHFMLEVCIIGIISEEVNSTSMSPYLSERLFSEEDWLTWANEHMRPATIVLGKTKTQGQQWYSFPVAGHTQICTWWNSGTRIQTLEERSSPLGFILEEARGLLAACSGVASKPWAWGSVNGSQWLPALIHHLSTSLETDSLST